MKKRAINEKTILGFGTYLTENEKSTATKEKYLRDVRRFAKRIGKQRLDRKAVLEYKESLLESYAVSSANSIIASLNAFWHYTGRTELCVKPFRIQKQVYTASDKELTKDNYFSLIQAAEKKRNTRLSLVVQTICSTGIRISELRHVTVEGVKRGECTVSCKGKTRIIFITPRLAQKLLAYAKKRNTVSGPVFVTRAGKPLDRSNVWREMKALCKEAGVCEHRVFPHNLRHLFARTFYAIDKDIAKLADILGHSSINTTRIYVMTTCSEHRRKMENLRLLI